MKKINLIVIVILMLFPILSFAQWEINFSEDEFGDPTDDKYGVCVNEGGEFSNSATTESDLTVVFFITENRIYFALWEYNSKNAYFTTNDFSYLYIKDNFGQKHTIKVYQSHRVIIVEKEDEEELLKLLKTNKNKLKCFYKEKTDYSSSVYHFTCSTVNFNEVYSEIYKKQNEFTISDVANCETLTKFLEENFEKNKENVDFLNKAVKLLGENKCVESDLFFKISEQLNFLQPSALSSYSLARMFIKKGENLKAIKYYDQAIDLQKDNEKKAQYYYELAALTGTKLGNPSSARSLALKAIELKPNWGNPYILIAMLYAADANNIGKNNFEHQAVFWAAVDKLQKAKLVDSSCASEADKYIEKYSANFPAKRKKYSEGSTYLVKSWINEETKVRFNNY